jgi:hypothetical protein
LTKLLDSSTAAALFTLHALALDRTLALDINYDALRPPECAWIVQLWDPGEREVTSARAPTLAQAVAATLDKVRATELA